MTTRIGIRLDHLVKALERERAHRDQRRLEFHDKLQVMQDRQDRLMENKAKRLQSKGINVDLPRIRQESRVRYLYTYMVPETGPESAEDTETAEEDPESDTDRQDSSDDSDDSGDNDHSRHIGHSNPDYELYRGKVNHDIIKLESIQEESVIERLRTITMMPRTKGADTQNPTGIKTGQPETQSGSHGDADPQQGAGGGTLDSKIHRAGNKLKAVGEFSRNGKRRRARKKLMRTLPGQFDCFGSDNKRPVEEIATNGVRSIEHALKGIRGFKDNHSRRKKKRHSD